MRRSPLIFALPSALLLSARTVQAPVSATAQTPTDTAVNAHITPSGVDKAAPDALLAQWLAPGNGACDAPGAVLMVDSSAGCCLKATGVVSLAGLRPMAVDDRLEIGSNTKALTVFWPYSFRVTDHYEVCS